MMGSITTLSSQSVAGERVEAHQDEEEDPEYGIDDVSHGGTPPVGQTGGVRFGAVSDQCGNGSADIRKS